MSWTTQFENLTPKDGSVMEWDTDFSYPFPVIINNVVLLKGVYFGPTLYSTL